MNIDILCVGKIKEKYFTDAINEYTKRLGRYCKLNIISVNDEKTPASTTDRERNIIVDAEYQRLQKYIKEDAYVIALAIDGRSYSSEKFANMINNIGINGTSTIQFVIGGSLGLSDEILKKADLKVSFSDMTFPHQLMRVILLEQIYRAYRIINNEPYHK